jgi:hypothetical protein
MFSGFGYYVQALALGRILQAVLVLRHLIKPMVGSIAAADQQQQGEEETPSAHNPHSLDCPAHPHNSLERSNHAAYVSHTGDLWILPWWLVWVSGISTRRRPANGEVVERTGLPRKRAVLVVFEAKPGFTWAEARVLPLHDPARPYRFPRAGNTSFYVNSIVVPTVVPTRSAFLAKTLRLGKCSLSGLVHPRWPSCCWCLPTSMN